jgi:hypothetical protein
MTDRERNRIVRAAYRGKQGKRFRRHNRRCHPLDVQGFRVSARGWQHLFTIKRVGAEDRNRRIRWERRK